MSEPLHFAFKATLPTTKQPFKVHGDGGGDLILTWTEDAYDAITTLGKDGRGLDLEVFIRATAAPVYGATPTVSLAVDPHDNIPFSDAT
jgi:hypothetical protein